MLAQWIERVQEAGSLPPAETGLSVNSWYGKFHGEMRMWHQSHHAAWGRPALFERSTRFYLQVLGEAKAYAKMQGYAGARWFKMRAREQILFTGPSSIGPLLLQEQPHPIIYAELLYRQAGAKQASVLAEWGELVQETAEFMADFALQADGFPPTRPEGCLNLGPPMAPGMGVEGSDPGNSGNFTFTMNGCYENTYWRFGLSLAQTWRKRSGKRLNQRWAKVQNQLCFPRLRRWRGASVYFYEDNSKELIGRSNTLGQQYACGHIPCMDHGINRSVMINTFAANDAEFDWSVAYLLRSFSTCELKIRPSLTH